MSELLFTYSSPLFRKEGAGGDLNDAKYTMRLTSAKSPLPLFAKEGIKFKKIQGAL